jgi:ABC-2 type transport system permease protein
MTRMTQAMAPAQSLSTGPAIAPGRSPGLWLPTYTLWRREMVRFFRQRSRVVGTLATPLIFWLFLGSGLDQSFVHAAGVSVGGGSGVGYREYFLPGTIVLMVLFTAVFSTITVIEDRREGFLQGVLVAPVPRLAIVLGKVLGGTGIALVQGVVLLAVWPLVTPWPGGAQIALSLLGALGILVLLAVGLTALGLCMAWPMDSTAAFHAVMNLVLVPMWFLSGAVFPIGPRTPLALRLLMDVNPLTYGQSAFAWVLSNGRISVGAPASCALAVLITACATVAVLGVAVWLVGRPRKDGM